MKTLLIVFTLLFLFGGIFLVFFDVGSTVNEKSAKLNTVSAKEKFTQFEDKKLTIKQIDSISAMNNLPFTKYNARNFAASDIQK